MGSCFGKMLKQTETVSPGRIKKALNSKTS